MTFKRQRLAVKTTCPKCKKRYALETIYAGFSITPIGQECKFCQWLSLKKDDRP